MRFLDLTLRFLRDVFFQVKDSWVVLTCSVVIGYPHLQGEDGGIEVLQNSGIL